MTATQVTQINELEEERERAYWELDQLNQHIESLNKQIAEAYGVEL